MPQMKQQWEFCKFFHPCPSVLVVVVVLIVVVVVFVVVVVVHV